MPTAPKYSRILLKVSGEALMGNDSFGINIDVVDRIAEVSVVDKDQFPKTPVPPVIVESVQRVR